MDPMNNDTSEHDLEGLSELLPNVMERRGTHLRSKDGGGADISENSTNAEKANEAIKDGAVLGRKLSVIANQESGIQDSRSGVNLMDTDADISSNIAGLEDDEEVNQEATATRTMSPYTHQSKAASAAALAVQHYEEVLMAPTLSLLREPPVIPPPIPRGLGNYGIGLDGLPVPGDHDYSHNNEGDDLKDDDDGSFDDYPDSDIGNPHHFQQQHRLGGAGSGGATGNANLGGMNTGGGQSISTATQTHEVRMPMYLPTFKPATGCTNASDFIVRCFAARLRTGITVVKHGRSRWCKSRLRVLHIHPDGRSLSWKPAEGEPTTSKRPPKLDLSTCLEVRHAWSPDPQNPMYTGTAILRQKCEAANAHKSFALIFRSRTVDITAVTADQCKVLMEGFSALCFRLQVANLAGRGAVDKGDAAKAHARPMPDEEASVTASNTLTNNSKRV
jgi:hypothetical protein